MFRGYFTALLTAGVLLCNAGSLRADGSIVRAKSVSLSDVSSAISSAHEGDTVAVPAGSASWASTLFITKGITLEGAGNDSTVILDEAPRPERGQQPLRPGPPQKPGQQQPEKSPNPSLSSGFVALLNAPGQGGRQNDSLLIVTLKPKQSFRMTGFTFRAGSMTARSSTATVQINGTCPSIRVDHCHFDQLYREHLVLGGCLYGVIDHCVFDARRGSSEILNVFHPRWGGGNNEFGDGSWAEPPYFGSDKFIFIEDCIFNNIGGVYPTNGSIDSWNGGRYVARYNVFNNTRPGNHGTETSARQRSCRAMEVYNNKFNFTIATNIGQIRGGTSVIHDNIFTGSMVRGWGLVVYREIWPFRIWGAAGGTSDWDVNDTEGDGTNVPGHHPHVHASGKHTGSNGSATLVVAGANWTRDQWIGYSVTNTTQKARTGFNYSSYIVSNTSDTITFFVPPDETNGHAMNFNTGDGFAIYKVLVALDQPGRGKGDVLSGNPPGPVRWPHQALEPIYAWNNTWNGTANYAVIKSPCPTLQEGRDYYSNTPLPGYKPYTYPHPLAAAVNRRASQTNP